MQLYGFWRSLATYRVRVALALKGLQAQEISINLLEGRQHDPAYTAINPEAVVPTLVLDDGTRLVQSLAICEYLDETHPKPPLLPKDALGRARVRGLALVTASDAHPLVVPAVRAYLSKQLKVDKEAAEQWQVHWTQRAAGALERMLADSPHTGTFCHGDAPTLADLCLASHVVGMTAYLKSPPANAPTVMRIFDACMKVPAFDRAHPLNQPDAKAH